MNTIINQTNDDLLVEEDTVLDGVVAGSAIVRPGKVLIINGMVTGNVVIEQGARVELNGIISGDVYNQAGNFIKNGVLAGQVLDTPNSTS